MKHYDIYLPEKIPNTIGLYEYEDGRPKAELEKDYCVVINGEPNWIKKGFVFDYASIPRLFWCLFLPNDPMYAPGALYHDLTYAAELFNRKVADDLFYWIMIAGGTPRKKAKIMYNAVRLFGGFTYKQHTAASVMKWRHLHGIHSTLRPLIPDYSPGVL